MKEIWLLIQKENEQLICPKSIYKSTNQKKEAKKWVDQNKVFWMIVNRHLGENWGISGRDTENYIPQRKH